MMEEYLTISKQLPALNSMQYKTLRDLCVERIQELSGKLWTDYNSHDPGITILEALSYVITDLGYRANYEIKEILAQDIDDPEYRDIKNFYTARQILPTRPLTENDFRKLMIDVELVEEGEEGEDTIYAGVKNAWIEISPDAEQAINVSRANSYLSLNEIPGVTQQDSYYAKTLFNVLLEFDDTEKFGDLNSNTIEDDLVIYEHTPDPEIEGLAFSIKIEFPRWDDENVDWEDPISIQANIATVKVKIYELPDNFEMKAVVTNKKEVVLNGTKDIGGTVSTIDGLEELMTAIHNFIYSSTNGLLQLYLQKVKKIHEIVDGVRATLHANRNLCDDFYRYHALKIEEILVCSDIELDPAADIDKVEANIYKAISGFLSPQVNFYTLDEMLTKCEDVPHYELHEIRKSKNTFIVNCKPEENFNKDDTVTVIDSGKNDNEYTVRCVRENRENPGYTDIEVEEDITTNTFDEGAYLIHGTIDESACLTIDRIFEGPKLKHGFIDEEELESTKRKKVIHVSDLIQIIMDVDGVVAVKSIQIANRPQDNNANIEIKSVKWCLELAMEQNYVPRLNIDDSKLTYYKDLLPFFADRSNVQTLIDQLDEKDRPQKIRYPVMDIPIPQGAFRDIEKYTSVQEEFPLFYGIGQEGAPGLSSLEGAERIARTTEIYQLKEFLLFFDQLLANYLSQLAHVKDLFSMNGERNGFGQYLIDRTYFTQPLFDIVPNADPLYVNKSGHAVALQQLTEDQKLYEKRRNKFLDHLLGRFAESFSDYAMLSFKMSGNKAASELIEDKLKFLNDYPESSSGRGTGLNYYDPCENWHVENVSGLEKRVSLLSGIEEKPLEDLRFSDNFVFVSGDPYCLQIRNDSSVVLFVAVDLVSENDALAAAEKIIVNGVSRHNYNLVEEEGGTFSIILTCNDTNLASSERSDFSEIAANQTIDAMMDILEREFYTNPESNRKNLACPLLNYFRVEVIPDMTPVAPDPPTFTISYSLYSEAFDFGSGEVLLTGSITKDAAVGDTEAQVIEKGNNQIYDVLWDVINSGMERGHYQFIPALSPFTSPYYFTITNRYGEEIARSTASDFNQSIEDEATNLTSGVVTISGSTGNDGDYTVSSANNEGPFVTLIINPVPSSPIFDGKLSWTETFAIAGIDRIKRSIEINHDVSEVLKKGDTITIQSSESNDGDYTLLNIEISGSSSILFVKEFLPADDVSGNAVYSKSFEMTSIAGNSVTIRGMEEEAAVQDMIRFISGKFFSREGMHVIEHVLLRPRINETLFVPIGQPVLTEGLASNGELYFKKSVPIIGTNIADSSITVYGDITGEIADNSLVINGGSFNDGAYILDSPPTLEGTNTLLSTEKEESPILFNLPEGTYELGALTYLKKATVDSVSSALNQIVISDADALEIKTGDIVEIKDSTDGNNDIRFMVDSVTQNGSDIEIIVNKFELLVQDELLPVHLDQECLSCQIKDPYSFIVSVVLPYWPDRFINLDYRKFMERTLRKEAPAHALLNICWIDCRQMFELETRYKKWLIETGRPEIDKTALSKALSELIEILTEIRNVYPTGTLHDCEDDQTLEGAIILNNSVLGTS